MKPSVAAVVVLLATAVIGCGPSKADVDEAGRLMFERDMASSRADRSLRLCKMRWRESDSAFAIVKLCVTGREWGRAGRDTQDIAASCKKYLAMWDADDACREWVKEDRKATEAQVAVKLHCEAHLAACEQVKRVEAVVDR